MDDINISTPLPRPTGEKIMMDICVEMDLIRNVTKYAWRLRIHPASYQILKDYEKDERSKNARPLFYDRDGEEYIRAIDNTTIPFSLDFRVVIDETMRLGTYCGTHVELDEGELKDIDEGDDLDGDEE